MTLVTDISTKISALAAEAVKQLAAECEDAEEKTNLEMIIPQVFYAMVAPRMTRALCSR